MLVNPKTMHSQALTALGAGLLSVALAGCGGGGGGAGADMERSASNPVPSPMTSPTDPVVISAFLEPPVLSFSDNGLSVTDGVTDNGRWSVLSPRDGVGFEYSLDMGRTWIVGVGNFFDVTGDGPKTIWVRSRDAFGNKSAVVMVNCVLDTQAPAAPSLSPSTQALTQQVDLGGLEPDAAWEYSLDQQATWIRGTGRSLRLYGHGLGALHVRQIDLAGNRSPANRLALGIEPSDPLQEASNSAMAPSPLGPTAGVLLVHGRVVRGDADYVRVDVPAGYRLAAVRLRYYESEDKIAFYAIQKGPAFTAGVDVTQMLSYGHFGPGELGQNLVEAVAPASRGEGAYTFWIQQTGSIATTYAVEIAVERN